MPASQLIVIRNAGSPPGSHNHASSTDAAIDSMFGFESLPDGLDVVYVGDKQCHVGVGSVGLQGKAQTIPGGDTWKSIDLNARELVQMTSDRTVIGDTD